MNHGFDYRTRQRRIRDSLALRELELLLITHPPNIRYLTGFTGSSAALVVSGREKILFTDGRYREQARAEAVGVRVSITKGAALAGAGEWIRRHYAQPSSLGIVLGIEGEHVAVATRERLRPFLPKKSTITDIGLLVEGVRQIKEPTELDRIRAAVRLGDELFPIACQAIGAGRDSVVREVEVAAALEFAARQRGAEGMSFSTIVAAGARSALPHGVASTAAIPRRGFVVLDFGVILAGYCSDMTRTVHRGRIRPEHRRWYQAVLEAQQAAIHAVRAGVSAGAVDEAARRVLRRFKLGKFFTHSTGHGVGLEIHETPRIAARQQVELQAGMVVTIEPGIYVAGSGGIRIEDMVVVTAGGCEVLTASSKELIEI